MKIEKMRPLCGTILAGLSAVAILCGSALAEGYDIYLLIGQSNMSGRGTLTADNAALVSSEGLDDCRKDLIHFETPSLRKFGERYAETMLRLQGGVSCSFDFIDLDKEKTCQVK